MKKNWWVHDEDGDLIASAPAESVTGAPAQFSYENSGWFAVPDGWSAVSVEPEMSR